MLRWVLLLFVASVATARPGFYPVEQYIDRAAVVSGHHLPPPLVKPYAHSPLYAAYPAVVKTPVVVAPAAGFVKAPVVPGHGLHGHYGHVTPYVH